MQLLCKEAQLARPDVIMPLSTTSQMTWTICLTPWTRTPPPCLPLVHLQRGALPPTQTLSRCASVTL